MKNKIFVLLLFLISLIAGLFIVNNKSNNTVETDTVSFSHYVHAKERKIKCMNCHRGVETQSRAGIPDVKLCSVCHSRLMNPASTEEKKIYELVKQNKTISWEINYTVPDYAYFSHRRHVKLGKLECSNCHGNMGEQTSPKLKNFYPLKMQVCLQCHESKKITTDCGSCHR